MKAALPYLNSITAIAAVCAMCRPAAAIVIPTGTTDAAVVAAGQAASGNGLFGAIQGVHQSGLSFHASVTMLTDFNVSAFAIQGVPANGSRGIYLGGFGKRGLVDGTVNSQDGKPGQWETKKVAVASDFVDTNIYGATKISESTIDAGGAPGDSGGRVGNSAGPIGVLTAADGISSSSVTYFVILSTPSVQSWIAEVELQYPIGTVFGVAAAHSAVDPADPVHFTTVDFTDFNTPSRSFNVIGTAINPSYSLNNTPSTFNGSQVDLALVAMAPVPRTYQPRNFWPYNPRLATEEKA